MYTNSSRSYLKMASGTPRRTNGTPWRTGGTPTAEYSVKHIVRQLRQFARIQPLYLVCRNNFGNCIAGYLERSGNGALAFTVEKVN